MMFAPQSLASHEGVFSTDVLAFLTAPSNMYFRVQVLV